MTRKVRLSVSGLPRTLVVWGYRLAVSAVLTLALLYFYPLDCFASPERVILTSVVVWRSDTSGDFTFKESGKLNGTAIASDGTVEYLASSGTYEVSSPYKTEGLVSMITVNWVSTGKVTMEVNATEDSLNYTPVTNGVPLKWDEFVSGNRLRWKAALSPGSRLTEVRIVYKDISGVIGSWGCPELSGLKFRKPVYIKGSISGDLFNYQIPIKVGESSQIAGCDVYVDGAVKSDFLDILFTKTDEESLLNFWRESVTGEPSNRVATFWVKIPQLPKKGLLIYLYYGKTGASDLSDGYKVFDFFDVFKGLSPDKEYKLQNGIVEYKAKITSKGSKVGCIIRGSAQDEELNQIVYSSDIKGIEHAIYIGKKEKINLPNAIQPQTFYNYRVIAEDKKLTFYRFSDNWAKEESGIEYSGIGNLTEGFLGLFTEGAEYEWVYVRQLAEPAPQIDISKTAGATVESPNLASFTGLTLTANGDLTLDKTQVKGEYLSPVVYAKLPARILVPDWKVNAQEENSLAIDISATGTNFKNECVNGDFYYASKKDFKEGKSLRWKARFARKDISAVSSMLREFALDYRLGAITLISPEAKEGLIAGAKYEIKWSAWEYEPSYKLTLEYSLDAGKTYNLIAKETENDGKYLWAIPNKTSDRAIVKISDCLNPAVYDVSNSTFFITKKGSFSSAGAGSSVGSERIMKTAQEEQIERAGVTVIEEAEIDLSRIIDSGERPDTQLYDIVIKLGDNKSLDPVEDARACYKSGDIVIVRPAGNNWSETERNSFLIVQAYLTEKESRILTQPKLIDTGKKDTDGQPIMETVKRRAHRFNLKKIGISEDKIHKRPKEIQTMRELLKGKKIDAEEVIEEK